MGQHNQKNYRMVYCTYLETCPLWGFKWESGTYSSYNTTGGSMRLVLPDRNNFLQNKDINTISLPTHTPIFLYWSLFYNLCSCTIMKKKGNRNVNALLAETRKLTASVSMVMVGPYHSLRSTPTFGASGGCRQSSSLNRCHVRPTANSWDTKFVTN